MTKMRSNGANIILLLASILVPALCKQASLVRIPECAENGHGTGKGIDEAKAERCQEAIREMYRRGEDLYTAPGAGCNRLVTYDPCDLFVCNGPNGGTGTISAGVIATAAQDIHSYCRLNGKVGGRVVVSDPDNNDQGSVLIQIGVINKDELKVRDVLDDDLVKTKELRSPVHISRPLFRRSDEELPVGIAEGVAEGDDVDMNVVELQNLCADFYNEFIRVRDQETNPNWRNTALIEREYEDEDGRFTVVMGYLARDGLRVDDAARDDRRLEEIIQETGGYWLSAGLRSIFSMHVFRRFVNAQEQEYHEEIGEIVIQAERRTGTPPLLLPGGSGPMA